MSDGIILIAHATQCPPKAPNYDQESDSNIAIDIPPHIQSVPGLMSNKGGCSGMSKLPLYQGAGRMLTLLSDS